MFRRHETIRRESLELSDVFPMREDWIETDPRVRGDSAMQRVDRMENHLPFSETPLSSRSMMIQWSVEEDEKEAARLKATNYTEIELRDWMWNNNFCHFGAVHLVECLLQQRPCYRLNSTRLCRWWLEENDDDDDEERKIEKFHWNVNLMDE